MRQSPLHAAHTSLGATFAPFAGWQMPVHFAGVLAEHRAVRSAAGVFDVSHLGTVAVSGGGAAAVLQRLLTNDVTRLGDGDAQYTLCCESSGGVVDDMIAYRRASEDFLLVPNAANTDAVVRRLRETADAQTTVTDLQDETAVLAVQGPSSPSVLDRVGLPSEQAYMRLAEATFRGTPVLVCRTGYTGERGYEVMLPAAAATELWEALLHTSEATGIVPCGLGARDTLRTEMGYPLHGQDLSREITPVQARLSWAVGWDSGDFVGRDALLRERSGPPTRRLWGLRAAGRAIPRPGMPVLHGGSRTVGTVTSGTFSPTLGVGIGLALLDPSVQPGDQVVLDLRGRSAELEVVRPPFVDRSPGDS
jgi:aminomethyltransferase